MKKKFFAFWIFLAVWIIFTGRFAFDTVLVGMIISLLATILFGQTFFHYGNRKFSLIELLKKISLLFLFIPVFFYEALSSALSVSAYVFKRNPSFSPGIVKVPTSLKNVTAISILANLITLTPGTLTLDFDLGERVYYIHWINVKTKEEAEARKEIIERFERWLDVIFR